MTRRQRGVLGGKATAEVLQDLYLKARIREAEEARKVEEEAREIAAARACLATLPTGYVSSAIEHGWEGLQVCCLPPPPPPRLCYHPEPTWPS